MNATSPTAMFRWLLLILVVIVLDQLSKAWVIAALPPGSSHTVTTFFDLVFVYNPGAAFSFLADHSGWQRWLFSALAIGISAWLLTLIHRHRNERLQPAAFALIVGGALGNLIDRFTHGAVVDFLYFHAGRHGWPAFNLADSAITLGVVLMLLAQLRTPHPRPETSK